VLFFWCFAIPVPAWVVQWQYGKSGAFFDGFRRRVCVADFEGKMQGDRFEGAKRD
jgi:hypothetical protein